MDPHIAGWNAIVNRRRVLNEEGLATLIRASERPLDNQSVWAMALELNRVGKTYAGKRGQVRDVIKFSTS